MSKLDNKETLTVLCKQHPSIASALRSLGMTISGASYKTFKKYCKKFGLVPPVMPVSKRACLSHIKNKIPDEEVFVQDSKYRGRGRSLKKRLIERGHPEFCAWCCLGTQWNDKPLNLHLDHINGINTDNRESNLRLLCPNCHSQTDTYCGRNTKKIRYTCLDCSASINKTSARCNSCAQKKIKPEKIAWPVDAVLSMLVWEKALSTLARDFNVSDNAIRKRCKARDIILPPQGYWSRN